MIRETFFPLLNLSCLLGNDLIDLLGSRSQVLEQQRILFLMFWHDLLVKELSVELIGYLYEVCQVSLD
ncbi:hypothetical protein ACFO0S_04255 [Chryseomicrobium palamuruense]|uniref:Uncharacterized protein n=1 Tax=Chryseomicrobium palamuruense TaxID=682973 RepID=A0ABV8UTM8_9BACL